MRDSTPKLMVGFFCAIALLYLYPFPYFEKLNSPNENARIYMVKAIVEHRTFAVDQVLRERPYVVDLAKHDGHFYSIKAPGPSLLGVPFYYLASRISDLSPFQETLLLRLVASTIPALVFLPFFFRFTRTLSDDFRLRLLVFLGLAVGSMYYTHALLLAGHETAAVALGGGFLCGYFNKRRENDSPLLLIFGGFLCAFSAASEYQALPASLAVSAYILWTMKRKLFALLFAVGAVPPAVLTGLVHYYCYGSPFLTGHHFPAEVAFQRYQQCGWRGLFCFSWAGLYGTFVSPANGLFFYAPWLLVSFPGLWFLFRRPNLRAEALCITAVIFSYCVTIAGMYAWKGGWSVGPRYLGAAMPFFAMAALSGLAGLYAKTRSFIFVFIPLWLIGIFIYGLSSPLFPHFPEELQNPFFEFLLPLAGRGYIPRNLGILVGLRGVASALPLLLVLILVITASVIIALDGFSKRFLKAVGILAVTMGLLFSMAHLKQSDPVLVQKNLEIAAQVWEPHYSEPVDAP